MKAFITTSAQYFLLIFLLPFLISSCKQETGYQETAINYNFENGERSLSIERGSSEVLREDTNVLVTVDTDNISEETKNENVFFTDDRSDASVNSTNPSEHVAVVDKNMKIYWRGEAKNASGDVTVDIIEVRRKADGGAEILEAVFRDPNKDGIVIGKIKNKKVSGLEYYDIVIRVNSESPQTFVIDPKLKMSVD